MSGFEMVFALFGLLLGLAIAEVLAGFALTWKSRLRAEVAGTTPVRIGWLVPLLGFLVVTDQTAFWMHAYALREAIPLTFLSLLAVLAVIGAYYLLATFVFPDEPEAWPDFDDYYLRINRIVIGGMIAIYVALIGFAAALQASGFTVEAEARGPVGNAAVLLSGAALIALWFVKSKRANLVLLVLLDGLVLVEAVAAATML
jgi:hypothetical protein